MKTRTQLFAAPLALALLFAAASPAPRANASARAAAQAQQYGPLERGYRTGYSDGYQAGWGDQLRRASADYGSKADYQRADRAYVAAYGSLEDYRDGYRQGFETGYEAGYARRGFDSNLPPGGVTRRGDVAGDGDTGGGRSDTQPAATNDQADADAEPSSSSSSGPSSASSSGSVRPDTVLLVELLNRLSTDVSQRGDRFEARVIEPREFEGAVLAGRLAQVRRPGKARGRAQLQLDFEQIRLPGGDWEEFGAQVVEVVPTGDDNVGGVDPEGGVRGKNSRKDDAVKVGAGAGLGAIIGAIAGGGKGAGIGAIIGASVGTAGVLTERGKEIRLERGQQMRIRATGRR
ncbi:MAG TPA: hypothetical protein VG148_18195 [Pyrinomonadaceae bacterium]|nr:hypothetical protein [Pyrinomonadaceae bacterium]